MKKSIFSCFERSLRSPKGVLQGLLGGLFIAVLICAVAVPPVSADETLGASFTFSPASPEVGESVTFSGSATGANITGWAWTFGDGSSASVQSPTHIYTSAGTFSVILTVTDAAGTTDTGTQSVTVTAAAVPPDASFTFSPANPSAGDSVTFTDTSTGDVATWSWAFGNGGVSQAQNPSNTYAVAGTYTVTLAVSDGGSETDTATQTITVAAAAAAVPTASFLYSPSNPSPGTPVTFTDTSTGNPDGWYWYFGNGAISNLQYPPAQTYESAGTYSVSLTVSNSAGTSSAYVQTITVGEESLEADFSYSPSSPDADEYVYFTDTSDGYPTGWEWDFGDNTGSESQNPSHKYSSDGTYTVELTVKKTGLSSDSVTRTITVGDATPTPTAGPKPDASFTWSPTSPVVGQAVSFTDTSTGTGINEWKWDFDDAMDFSGNRESTLKNPQHTYQNAGSYDVTLFVKNSGGSDIILKTITVRTVQTSARFNAYPSSGTAPLSVRFVDASTGADIESYHWDFGNGRTYDGKSPSNVVYSSPGTYTASLEIEDESGDTDEYTMTIRVSPPATATAMTQTAVPTATPASAAEDAGLIDGEYRKMTGLYNEYIKILFGFLGIDDEPDFLIIAVK
ncbi:PKD domain-containing protein [Methanogenium organophilum]|uniref:PKD domain-containing protein n=1 Tax=Methanogenium organophilum TaxID=2199 RepID=A0A9X9S682_METOG|nr:PKD domain-containing protein [Methanogenium organophilum]WAI02462.1 PKD domain-containing protein [Methanogenium organophilum]